MNQKYQKWDTAVGFSIRNESEISEMRYSSGFLQSEMNQKYRKWDYNAGVFNQKSIGNIGNWYFNDSASGFSNQK